MRRAAGTSLGGYGPAFRALTVTGLASAYLLVVLGDTVRVTESGMGCISWPLCNGQAGLTGTYHAVLEQSHRYLAAVVTILVAAIFVTAWRRASADPLVYRSALASLSLIGTQVVLGAVTVLTHNAGWTVALHLADAWLVLGAVTVTTLGVWRPPAPAAGREPGTAHPWRAAPAGLTWAGGAAALFALAVSGMLVLHEGASNACRGWPACGGGTMSAGLVALQYLHRSLALLATVVIVTAAWQTWRSPAGGRASRVLSVAAVTLLAGTAAAGAIVAVTGAPPAAQAVHLAAASALWITLVAMASPTARAASLHRPAAQPGYSSPALR